MGSSVTYCKICKACNWAGKDKCTVCGGELEPTMAEVYNHYYKTDPEFKVMADKNNDESHCSPNLG